MNMFEATMAIMMTMITIMTTMLMMITAILFVMLSIMHRHYDEPDTNEHVETVQGERNQLIDPPS